MPDAAPVTPAHEICRANVTFAEPPGGPSLPTRRALAPPPPAKNPYGVVVDSVNVSVFEYAPVRSASVAPMCCLNAIVTGSLETGAVQVALLNATSSG